EDLGVHVRVTIHESGSDHVAVGVEGLTAALTDAADRDDAAVPHPHVCPEPGQTGAIDHRSVLDHEVVRHGVVLPGVVTVSYPSQGGSANCVIGWYRRSRPRVSERESTASRRR